MRWILPETDAGAFVQLVIVVAVGVPALIVFVRRGWKDGAWLVAGVLVAMLGFFALRAGH